MTAICDPVDNYKTLPLFERGVKNRPDQAIRERIAETAAAIH